MAAQSSGALHSSSRRAASASRSPSGASTPVTPSTTTSGMSQCVLLATGMPEAAISVMTTGAPPSQSPSAATRLGERKIW